MRLLRSKALNAFAMLLDDWSDARLVSTLLSLWLEQGRGRQAYECGLPFTLESLGEGGGFVGGID